MALLQVNQSTILSVGGVATILTAMSTHLDQVDVQLQGCMAIGNFSLAKDNADMQSVIVEDGGINRISTAMTLHADDAAVQREACVALRYWDDELCENII